jgi:hypothetical protein
MFFLSFGTKILSDETSDVHYYMLHIMAHLSVLLFGLITVHAVVRFRSWKSVTPNDWANDAIFVIFALSIFGQTFGYYTRDMDGFKHDVILKGVEMKDVSRYDYIPSHGALFRQR